MDVPKRKLKQMVEEDKEREKLNEKRSQALDEHNKIAKGGGAINSPREISNHRTVTKKVSGGRTRLITRLRSKIGFKKLHTKV